MYYGGNRRWLPLFQGLLLGVGYQIKHTFSSIFFYTDTIDTGPGQCIKCANSQFGPLRTCGSSQQWNQSCLIDPSSFGPSHCGSATIKYLDFSDATIKTDVIRGCFNCSGK